MPNKKYNSRQAQMF
jgi:hypothetical protein